MERRQEENRITLELVLERGRGDAIACAIEFLNDPKGTSTLVEFIYRKYMGHHQALTPLTTLQFKATQLYARYLDTEKIITAGSIRQTDSTRDTTITDTIGALVDKVTPEVEAELLFFSELDPQIRDYYIFQIGSISYSFSIEDCAGILRPEYRTHPQLYVERFPANRFLGRFVQLITRLARIMRPVRQNTQAEQVQTVELSQSRVHREIAIALGVSYVDKLLSGSSDPFAAIAQERQKNIHVNGYHDLVLDAAEAILILHQQTRQDISSGHFPIDEVQYVTLGVIFMGEPSFIQGKVEKFYPDLTSEEMNGVLAALPRVLMQLQKDMDVSLRAILFATAEYYRLPGTELSLNSLPKPILNGDHNLRDNLTATRSTWEIYRLFYLAIMQDPEARYNGHSPDAIIRRLAYVLGRYAPAVHYNAILDAMRARFRIDTTGADPDPRLQTITYPVVETDTV